MKKLLIINLITTVVLVLVLALIISIVKNEMVYTGVAVNPSILDVIKYIYHGLF